MILVDSNVIMYAAGSEHAHRHPSIRFLTSVAKGEIDAAVDAQVLQEILHRYRAIQRWNDGKRVHDLARQIFLTVLPVTVEIMDGARALMEAHPALMARDALHATVVSQHALEAICSYDRDFDGIETAPRIEP